MPYDPKFQLLRLSWNGFLPPPQVGEIAYLVQQSRKLYSV